MWSPLLLIQSYPTTSDNREIFRDYNPPCSFRNTFSITDRYANTVFAPAPWSSHALPSWLSYHTMTLIQLKMPKMQMPKIWFMQTSTISFFMSVWSSHGPSVWSTMNYYLIYIFSFIFSNSTWSPAKKQPCISKYWLQSHSLPTTVN